MPRPNVLRCSVAPLAAAAFVAFGPLATVVPNFCPCFRFAWIVGFAGLATGTAALATTSKPLRFLIGAVAAAIAVHTLDTGWDDFTDRLVKLSSNWTASLIGVLFSFAPVYHVIRVQDKLAGRPPQGGCRRMVGGAYIGFVQAVFITVLVAPLFWFLLPQVSGVRLPPEIARGPAVGGRFACVAVLAAAIVIAGTAVGAIAAIIDDKHLGP